MLLARGKAIRLRDQDKRDLINVQLTSYIAANKELVITPKSAYITFEQEEAAG
jgi:hypothetical protein